MTIDEYISDNNYKPLTDREIGNKHKAKIRGTDDLIPWTEVYTRLSAGMSILDVIYIYGNGRKIALFAKMDGIEVNDVLSDTLDQEILQRRKMGEIEAKNPEVARTMKEMVNEYAPDVGRDVIMLSKKLVAKAVELVEEDECSSNDLNNIAKAVQTMTDTIEITQRHSAGAGLGNVNIAVQGFSFIEDLNNTGDNKISDVIDTIEVEDN